MSGNTRFDNAKLKVVGGDYALSGIGTLSEKAIHRILKFYIEPNDEYHEREYLGSVADILNSDGIYEIQTRAAGRLVPKLEKFLRDKAVTVVLPIITVKYIRKYDKASGSISPPKKSPKRESVYTAFREIYGIRSFLENPNLKIKLILFEAEEYKVIDSDARACKSEKIPTAFVGEFTIESKSDFYVFLPEKLPESFTSAEFAKLAKIPKKYIFYVVKILSLCGIIECVGKNGRTNIYEVIK